MRRFFGACAAAALALPLFATAPAVADDDDGLSAAQEEAVRDLIRETILENPEIVVEALQLLEERQRQAEAERRQQALAENLEALTRDPADPVLGNPDGDVTLVEFFDYNCPYCRRVAQPVVELAEADGNVRLVMKEWPILGEESFFAARAALAAAQQGLYEELHLALMEREGRLTQDQVMQIAEAVGLDTERLAEDMRDPAITQALQRTYDLAEALGITGTPAFVVGDEVLPGAVTPARLQQAIDAARDGG